MKAQVKKPKVLIIDDASTNIRMLIEILKNDYVTVPATSGEAGLEKAQLTPLPDLILLDIMMPGMDGYEVCKRLKASEKTKHIPVIFITAISEAMDNAKSFDLGAADYVTKPFNPDTVKARLKHHINLRDAVLKLELANDQLRERQNIIARLLRDISQIRFSGERHAMRNLAQKIFEKQKMVIIQSMARQIHFTYKLLKTDREKTISLHEYCESFGVSAEILSDPAAIESKLREVEIEKTAASPESSDKPSQELPDDDFLINIFQNDKNFDEIYEQFKGYKAKQIESKHAHIMKDFDPFVHFLTLRDIRELITEINKRFSGYDTIRFIEKITLSKALEIAKHRAVAEKEHALEVIEVIDFDPEFSTNKESLIYMLRDFIYNAMDAEATRIKVCSYRPAAEKQLPYINQCAFEDYPSVYISLEDNGNGITTEKAAQLNEYLIGGSDDATGLTTKGKAKGGLGTKNLRGFLLMHKGCCIYDSTQSGAKVHLYFGKLEI